MTDARISRENSSSANDRECRPACRGKRTKRRNGAGLAHRMHLHERDETPERSNTKEDPGKRNQVKEKRRARAAQEVSLFAFEVGGLRITRQPISGYSSFLGRNLAIAPGVSSSFSDTVSRVYRALGGDISKAHVVDINIRNTRRFLEISQ